jgi:UrcA family protein
VTSLLPAPINFTRVDQIITSQETHMNKLNTLITLATLAFAFVTLPAQAADSTITKSTTVKFADLDLSKPEGARTLYTRIQAAARQVCSPANLPGVVAKQNYRQCYDKAVNDAVGAVNRPLLSALHHTNGSRSG